MNGWSNCEMYLFCWRLNTSLNGTGAAPIPGTVGLLGVPIDKFFDQVKVVVEDRPCEYRFVALICNESYQVFPSGDQRELIEPNCGNGLND